jgi:hypothetical protein
MPEGHRVEQLRHRVEPPPGLHMPVVQQITLARGVTHRGAGLPGLPWLGLSEDERIPMTTWQSSSTPGI